MTVVTIQLSAACKLGLEGIVSKKLNAPYKSGPSKAWLKIKNPNAPAATRAYRCAHMLKT
jgi:ATP-dependent DNA ligase